MMDRMQASERIEIELIELIRPWIGFQPITPESALHHDLHVDGDDTWELLEEIVRVYGTSFDGFDFSAYFPNETGAVWISFAERLGFFKGEFRRLTI